MAAGNAWRRIVAGLEERLARAYPRRTFLAPLALFCLPFLYFYRYTLPDGLPVARRIGNDFPVLYLKYKVYLLDCLGRFDFPFWSPAEGCGYPFYANPFTQAFYPLNVPLAAYARLTGGWSRVDHQVFTVLGVALFAVGLYFWLRSLRFRVLPAAGTALCIGLCYRMAEIVRFPNAVHAAAWYPYVLWGMTLILLRGRTARGALLAGGATVMMITAGYPYYVYYTLFLFPVYAAILSLPTLRRGLGAAPGGLVRAWAAMGGAFLAAGILCAPYVYKMRWMLMQTMDRSGADAAWSGSGESLPDFLTAFFYPPASATEGWFFFGQAALLVILAHLLVLWRRGGRTGRTLAVSALALTAFVTSIALGQESPVFALLHAWLPGFSALREWQRLNIVLVAPMALLLAPALTWLFDRLLAGPQGPEDDGPRIVRRLAACWALMFLAQIVLFSCGLFDQQWSFHRRGVFSELFFPLTGILSFLLVRWAVLRAPGRTGGRIGAAALVLAGILALNLLDLGFLGSGFWSRKHKESLRANVTLTHDVAAIDALALTTPRRNTRDTIALAEDFNVGRVPNWYYERFMRLSNALWGYGDDYAPLVPRPDADPLQVAAMGEILGLNDGRRLFFTRTLDHGTPADFLADARGMDPEFAVAGRPEYDGDSLALGVACAAPGWLTFVDAWDPDWTAEVDGVRVDMAQALGAFKSVRLDAGEHRVLFRYVPFSSELDR